MLRWGLHVRVLVVSLWAARFVSGVHVFAHFMVQNSNSYTQEDWASDIATAQSIGIDGFALNIASATDYEPDRIVDAYAAAESAGFLLHFSFDMAGGSFTQSEIADLVERYADSPSSFRWSADSNSNSTGTGTGTTATAGIDSDIDSGSIVVSTFSGEGLGPDFWDSVKSELANRGVPICFAPGFIGYRDPQMAEGMVQTFKSVDGFFNWWSWPQDVNTTLTTETDLAYKDAVKGSRTGPFIMSVSPWQFKELGGSNNWVEQSDTLWNYRWLQAIEEVKPDVVQIVTWNDYAESHYIGEINPKVELFDAANYVVGFDHSAWRVVAQYYIGYFKNGTAPNITTDQLVYWYRVHPRSVTCANGERPRFFDYPADAVFALAFLGAPANVSIDVGSSHGSFEVGAGVTLVSVPFGGEDNQTPEFGIERGGEVVKEGKGVMEIMTECAYYNFNPITGVI